MLVTGSASGVGLQLTTTLIDLGAKVIAMDIQPTVLSAHQGLQPDSESSDPSNLVTTIGDVRSSADVQSSVALAIERWGRLDALMAVAGVCVSRADMGSIADTTEQIWRDTMDTNLYGVFVSMKYALKAMLARERGSIVAIASQLGLIGQAGLGAYVASKHGIIGLTQSAAAEYVHCGIRINAVCPGLVRTPMVEKLMNLPKTPPQSGKGQPSPMGDIIQTCLWLASDESAGVNGQTIEVGTSLRRV